MRLRSRLLMTFGLACAALVVVVAIAIAAWGHEQQGRFNELILDTQQLAWQRFEVGAIDRLRPIAESLSKQPQLSKAFTAKDVMALQRMLPGNGADIRLDAFDTSGELIFSTSAVINIELQVDMAGAQKVLRGQPMVVGVTPTIADGLKFVASIPVRRGNQIIGGIALGVPLEPTLVEFAASLARRAAFVDLRGHALSGDGAALFNETGARVPLRKAAVVMVPRATGNLRVALTPVAGPDGHLVGSIATLQNVDLEQAADRRWRIGIAAIALIVAVAVLATLFVRIRSALSPLDSAVNVLTALSHGDTSRRIDAEHNDEAGLIAEGIARLREELLNLELLREERERERWRQETIVRDELRELAGTLDDDGRRDILDGLQGALAGSEQVAGERNQLAVLAFVMQRLSQRIRAQQSRLHKLISDLNEALSTKEAFVLLQQELEIARRMQLTVLPRQFPVRPDVSLASFILPAKEVGGDFYDYFPLEDGRLGVVIADVSGKGVPAAFFMAICRTLIKVTARFLNSPAATLARVNALLAAENEEMMFVTLFYGILNPTTGEFVYASAGHNPPVLRSGEGARLLKSQNGIALAVNQSAAYIEHKLRLQLDDVLFLYTDGVTEAQNEQGVLFGESALLETLASGAPGSSVEAISDRVVTAVRKFAGDAPQADDITCVTLRFTGSGTK